MGLRTTLSQMAGAVFAWGLVGPLVRQAGWTPGPIGDYDTGVQGWLVWFSLAVIFGESMASLLVVIVQQVLAHRRRRFQPLEELQDPAGMGASQVPTWMWGGGLAISSVICCIVCTLIFEMQWYEPVLGVLFSMLV